MLQASEMQSKGSERIPGADLCLTLSEPAGLIFWANPRKKFEIESKYIDLMESNS